jgi:aspartate aminotransferase
MLRYPGAVVVSATLAINEAVKAKRLAGHQVLQLGFGEAGLPVLPELTEQLGRAAYLGGYPPVAGADELRQAAALYWQRRGLPTDAKQVVAGPGSKPLLYALLSALDGGVALPQPSWVSYAAQAVMLGRDYRLIPTRPGHGGLPDPDLLDASAAQARADGSPLAAVLVTLPDNPTGTLAPRDAVADLCAVAQRHGLIVISDEIYRDLVHDPNVDFLSPATVLPEQTVITSGLSKNLAVGGWRLGLARFPDNPAGLVLRDRVVSVASEIWSGAALPVQHAAAWALSEPPSVKARIDASRCLHARVARAAAERLVSAGVEVEPPAAAFYLYPGFAPFAGPLADRSSIHTDVDLARHLLDRYSIATLPGSAFGDRPERLRLRLATSLLYGRDEQRVAALEADRPQELAWIARAIDQLGSAVTELVS